MHEITNTRTNHLIDPSLQIWGWEIPIYLFLGGLVAGIMIITGYFIFRGNHLKQSSAVDRMPLYGIILLSAGMLALFLDLEHKLYTWRLYTTFMVASPMSWGSWILLIVYPAMIAVLLVRPPQFLTALAPVLEKYSSAIHRHPALVKNIGVLNMILGAMLGIYTGVLLSSLGARPLWNSGMLWVLFLVSGLSAAAAFVHMIAPDREERELLAKADNGFLILELFVIALFVIGLATSTKVHIEAAQLLLTGSYAPVFWVFIVGMGIVIPLIIQLLAVNHKIRHTVAAPILVIAGGLVLRFVIVYAGQVTRWIDAAVTH